MKVKEKMIGGVAMTQNLTYPVVVIISSLIFG